MTAGFETLPRADDLTAFEKDLQRPELDPERRAIVIIGGGGANARHMDEAVKTLMLDHPVYVFEYQREDDPGFPCADPSFPVEPDNVFFTNTEDGQARAQELLESGTVHAVYLSTRPEQHEEGLLPILDLIGQGKINMVVVPKPVVADLQSRRTVNAAVRETKLALFRSHDEYGSISDVPPFIWTHEHFPQKAIWQETFRSLRDQRVREFLGRLTRIEVDIEESRTVEGENRQAALAGGALLDLTPHTNSLVLDGLCASFDRERFSMSGSFDADVTRLRYMGSELQDTNAETGFIIEARTGIYDRDRKESHIIEISAVGGKGLKDQKRVKMEFTNPDDGTTNTIEVDFIENEVHVPSELKLFFPPPKEQDNGYGPSVVEGMRVGGDADAHFQHWIQAKYVTYLEQVLYRLGRRNRPVRHGVGLELRNLAFYRDKDPLLFHSIAASSAREQEIGPERYMQERIASGDLGTDTRRF